jgi:hypothetical protein
MPLKRSFLATYRELGAAVMARASNLSAATDDALRLWLARERSPAGRSIY